MPRPIARTACALVLALAACGGSDGTGPAQLPQPLVGHWLAGPACKAAGCAIDATVAGSSTPIPLTDSLTVDLQLAASGTVVSTLTYGSFSPRIVQGIARAQGNTLVIDYPGSPSDTIAYAFQGALLRFDFQNTLQLPDVTGDGVPDRLRMSVLFARH